MEPVVLRLPRLEHGKDEADFVLVHVSSAGRHALDLKLIGTENSAVFSVSLKHNQTSKLKSKTSTLNQEEWENILISILLATFPEGASAAVADGVEAVAKVEDGASSITITIQRRIEGITQRLGTISLPANEDSEVDIYEWCGLTVKAKENSSTELKTLKAILREKDEQIRKMEESFAELVKLKNENDTQLLEKFSLLLNEKKLKIRDQQRLLQSSSVDPAKLETIEQTRSAAQSRSAGPSRGGKRKAGQVVEDDESDSGFEKMDVDEQSANDSDLEQPQTPDDSTVDEAESEDDEPTAPPLTRKTVNNTQSNEKETGSKSTAPPENTVAPPKRELPFAKKQTAPPLKASPAVDGSETESDDEL